MFSGVTADRCDLLCLDLPKAEAVRSRLPRPADVEAWAAGARALGDPTRLGVAMALRDAETACVCDLAWVVGRDEKLVSHHLRLLRTAGLAGAERRGKMVIYALTPLGLRLVEAVTEGVRV